MERILVRSSAPYQAGEFLRVRDGVVPVAPPRERCIVACTCVDPPAAVRRLFLFPERRFRLQVIDDEAARIEGVTPVGARYGDEHDLIGWRERADAMDNKGIVDVE